MLDRTKEGVLSTIGQDGYPYGTPINFVRIGDDIYFHGRNTGEKVDNLKACGKVCLTVMVTGGFERCGPEGCNTTTIYESAVVRGTASEVTDGKEKIDALRATIAKLTPERIPDGMDERRAASTAVYRIRMESVTGKYRSPAPGNQVIQ